LPSTFPSRVADCPLLARTGQLKDPAQPRRHNKACQNLPHQKRTMPPHSFAQSWLELETLASSVTPILPELTNPSTPRDHRPPKALSDSLYLSKLPDSLPS